MERMINKRLNWYLEKKNFFLPAQAGFPPGMSTHDILLKLETMIKNGWYNKKETIAVCFDLCKAYDKTWIKSLILKIIKTGITGKPLRWVNNFIIGRKIRTRIGNFTSETKKITSGVPQGAILSPSFFNIMMQDFPKPPPDVELYIFADGITVSISYKQLKKAEEIMQGYIDIIQH